MERNISLKEFRRNAEIADDSFRDALLAYRKSLSNPWDYNAYVGILLGVRGPKHGDKACYNYAIGQGDNGNNTKNVLNARGLMPLFDKYKGKRTADFALLCDVEDEIVASVPEYDSIRSGLHRIIDGTTYDNDLQKVEVIQRSLSENKKNIQPAAENPCFDDALELGVYYMDIGQNDDAYKYLKLAKDKGIKDADIYLNYLEHYNRAKYQAIPCQRMSSDIFEWRLGSCSDSHSNGLLGNVQEYKGYLYIYYSPDRKEYNPPKFVLSRINIASGSREELVAGNLSDHEHWLGGVRFCMDDYRPHFSIMNDVIYFEDAGGISMMNIDGMNRRCIQQFSPDSKFVYTMPIVFPRFMIYRRNKLIYKYDYASKTSEHISNKDIRDIAGISEKEINFGNKMILNLETLRQEKVTKVYPLLRGKKEEDIWYIDMAREIAYHLERSEKDYKRCRMIGSNKEGKIVDIWKLPYYPEGYRIWHGNYDSCCFNEYGLSIKFSYKDFFYSTEKYRDWYKQNNNGSPVPKDFEAAVYIFDRLGNGRILYQRNSKNGIFGEFHMQTENTVVVLERGKGEEKYYASMLSKRQSGSNQSVFLERYN